MRPLLLACVFLALAVQTSARDDTRGKADGKPKTDQEHIQGIWSIVGLETGGKPEPESNYKGNTFAFFKEKGVEKAVLKEGKFPSIEFTFALDPTKNPKTITLTAKGNTLHGVYKLDGDDLTMCICIGGTPPTEFATKAGGDTEIFTLKRTKWERYTDQAFGFTVDLPGKPTEKTQEVETPTGRATTTIFTVGSEMERVSYVVSVTPMPAKLDAKSAEAALDAVQKAMLAEVEKAAKAKVESEKPVFKAPNAFSATRELTIGIETADAKEKGVMRVRLLVAGDRLYTLTATGTEESIKTPGVGQFWGSFKLPPDSKLPPEKK